MEDFYKYFQDKYKNDIRGEDSEALLEDVFCVHGDDGVEFLEDFLTHFNVHVEWIDYKAHFAPEGLVFILKKFIPKEEKPLKIKHLIKAYETRNWEYFE